MWLEVNDRCGAWGCVISDKQEKTDGKKWGRAPGIAVRKAFVRTSYKQDKTDGK